MRLSNLLRILEECKEAKPGDKIRISLMDYFEVQDDGTMKIKTYTPEEFLEEG